MAKTGFWLRGAKGKLAGTTLYKDPTTGETIMREIVTPANPKTDAQLMQRIIMHTIAASYGVMKEICDHSFEGMKPGRETMSYFMKQNIQRCREAVNTQLSEGLNLWEIFDFLKLGVKGYVNNQYQLSMGSLPQVDATIYARPQGNNRIQDVGLVQGINDNTYAAVINALGLKRGDQLTFIGIKTTGARSAEFNYARVILDPTDPTTHEALPLSTAFLDANNKVNAPSVRNEGNFRYDIDANGLQFSPFGLSSLTGVSAVAVIVSRKVGDSWNRSNSYLAYDGFGHTSLGEALDAAKEGIQTDIYTPADLYLNNAGEGGGSAAASASEGGSSQGGGSVATPQLTAVRVDGQTAIQGTTKFIEKPEGTSFPVSVTVAATANAAAAGYTVKVYQGSTLKGSQAVNNGAANVTFEASEDELYSVKLGKEGESDIATGFSFQLSEASDNGGGSADE